MAGKLKPLDIQREDKPGKYADGERRSNPCGLPGVLAGCVRLSLEQRMSITQTIGNMTPKAGLQG